VTPDLLQQTFKVKRQTSQCDLTGAKITQPEIVKFRSDLV